MSIQVFNQSGNLLLNVTDRITRYVGTYYVVAGPYPQNSGFVAVPGMADDGTWLAYGDLSAFGPPVYIFIGAGGFSWQRANTTLALNTPVTVLRV